MNPLRRCSVLPLVILSLSLSAVALGDDASGNPASIVTAIYQRVAKGKGDSGGQFLWLDAKDRPKSFSKSLVALWAKADAATPQGDEGPVDFDPVTNSQDPGVKTFVVTREKQSAAAETIAVTFTESGAERRSSADRTIRYDFVREGGRWMIDDIRGSADGQPWSLRKILTDSLQP